MLTWALHEDMGPLNQQATFHLEYAMMRSNTSIYYIIHVYVKEKSICILISN